MVTEVICSWLIQTGVSAAPWVCATASVGFADALPVSGACAPAWSPPAEQLQMATVSAAAVIVSDARLLGL
ncbi:MAG TPA: hypothetical protein VNW50_00385 [Streptosporangiaceae bacterium]|nr:hypothetical protein [Streptosporangiaceae bacterium]